MTPADQFIATLYERNGRPPRLVLDSTIVVSALMFGGGPAARLRHAWQEKLCLPLLCKATLMDLTSRLGHPRLGLSLADRHQLLGDYLPHAMKLRMPAVEQAHDPQALPSLPFVRLAMVGRAHAVVTSDPELLGLNSPHLCPMLSLDATVELLQQVRRRSSRLRQPGADKRRSA